VPPYVYYSRKNLNAVEVQFFNESRAEAANKERDTNMEKAFEVLKDFTIRKILVTVPPKLVSTTTARDTTLDDNILIPHHHTSHKPRNDLPHWRRSLMPIKLIGDTVTLSAGASDIITLRSDIDVSAKAILWNSSGRCKITRLEFPAGVELLKGSLELEQLNKDSHRYVLPEAISLSAGVEVRFHLTDISGASNVVYVALECTY